MKTSAKYFNYIFDGGKMPTESQVEMYGKICELEGKRRACLAPIRRRSYAEQLEAIEQTYNLKS